MLGEYLYVKVLVEFSGYNKVRVLLAEVGADFGWIDDNPALNTDENVVCRVHSEGILLQHTGLSRIPRSVFQLLGASFPVQLKRQDKRVDLGKTS